jgi:hypothetical protein
MVDVLTRWRSWCISCWYPSHSKTDIFKAARVTDELIRLSPLCLSAMSANLDSTLVVDSLRTIHTFWWSFLSIDMVQLSSAWLSQQCTFFYPLVFHSCLRLIDFFVVCTEVHDVPFHVDNVLDPTISSFLRPGLVLLHTSKWRLVPQNLGKEFNPDFLSIVDFSIMSLRSLLL